MNKSDAANLVNVLSPRLPPGWSAEVAGDTNDYVTVRVHSGRWSTIVYGAPKPALEICGIDTFSTIHGAAARATREAWKKFLKEGV